jgi:hypothetical protein
MVCPKHLFCRIYSEWKQYDASNLQEGCWSEKIGRQKIALPSNVSSDPSDL